MRALLIALAGLLVLSEAALAEYRTGRRLDAIQSGRLYDPVLTPRMNPGFHLGPNAEADFLRDVRRGRFDLDRLPEAQRDYYMMKLHSDR